MIIFFCNSGQNIELFQKKINFYDRETKRQLRYFSVDKPESIYDVISQKMKINTQNKTRMVS